MGEVARGRIDAVDDPAQTIRGEGNIDGDDKAGVMVVGGERIGFALLMSR